MRSRTSRAVTIFALAILFPVLMQAQGFDPAARLPVDPSVRIGKLANGLTYYIRANASPEKRAQLRLVVNAGSVLESDTQQGLAHFVEHMAFNGTEGFRKMQIVEYLESIGMRFGPEINAYTSFDETVYQLEVPTDQSAILDTAFRILSEWAARLSFEPEEIAKERGVVLEEWRLGRGANGRIQDKQFPVLLQGSRYAERLPIGKRDSITGAPGSEIVKFYRDWYRPDLMAVVAVGDFDPARIETVLQAAFSTIPVATQPRAREQFGVPDHRETLYSVVTDPEATQSVVSLYVTNDVEPFVTVGDYRKKIVASLATMMLNSRLGELARKVDAPFIQASAGVDRLVRTKEAFSLGALVTAGGIERGLEAVLTEVERVRVYGFTESELKRAKDVLMRGMDQYHREQDKSTSRQFAEEYVRAFLTSEPIPGIEYEYNLHAFELPDIGLQEVNARASTLLTETNRVVLAEGPDKPGVSFPGKEALAAVFEKVKAATVQSYVDTATDRPLIAEPPRKGAVVSEQSLDAIGAVRWILSNGANVILKPTSFKNDEVLFQAFSPGGSSLVSDKDYVSAIMATSVVAEGGLDGFSSADLQKKLAGTGVRVSPWIQELFEGLQGSASPRDLETLFQLIYLDFTSPRRDEAAFRSFKERYQGAVANRSASPEVNLGDTLRSIMSQNNVRSRPLTTEVLSEMDLDRSLSIYRDRLSDASDFTFIFVGNIDLAATRPLVETYIGGLESTGRRETWKDLGVDPPSASVQAEVRKGLEPKSRVSLRFAGRFPYSRDEVVSLTALADILELRLLEQLREELSGTYSPSVSATAQKYPDQEYQIAIDFGCDPARVEELTKAVFQSIGWARDGVIDPIYLTKEKEALRRQREQAVKENGFWLSAISSSLMNNEDPAEVLKFPDRVQALTADKVRLAARSYLPLDRYVRVVLYPESGS